MSKSKKNRTPQVDLRVLTAPRLDTLFDRHAHGELDEGGLVAGVKTLAAEVGQAPVLTALVKRIESTSVDERMLSMSVVSQLKSRETIDYLWRQVKTPRALSLDAKLTALVMLKEMGEDVDLKDPGLYFSPRDFKPSDMKSLDQALRMSWRSLARSLRAAQDVVEVEAYMQRINQMPDEAMNGTEILLAVIKDAESVATDLEADLLHAFAYACPRPEVRLAAAAALERLADRGVTPVTPVILAMGQERFYGAYMTHPNHPWQQNVTVAWEWKENVVQALIFLIDFGLPWGGAIKDVFSTMGMTRSRFEHEIVRKSEQDMDLRLYRVSLYRAQATITAAYEANQTHNIPLPKDFNEFRHLMDQWVLHPPVAALKNDTTVDELASLPLTPDHSQRLPMLDLHGFMSSPERLDDESALIDEDEDVDSELLDAFKSFDDVLQDVQSTYDQMVYLWWRRDWVAYYLTSLADTPDDLEFPDDELQFIAERWLSLKGFIEYADEYASEVAHISDLRGFHLSHFVEAENVREDKDGGVSRIDDIQAFFDYLAEKGLVPLNLPVRDGIKVMLAQPGALTLIQQPKPYGGEVALWLTGQHAGEYEPITFNQWWMTLVLRNRFDDAVETCRVGTRAQPDAETKLALLTDMESRLDTEGLFFRDLDDARTVANEDIEQADQWFTQARVSMEHAW